MKIHSLEIENFKRFTHLKLDLKGEEKRLVVLVGPNGCGKSSVFDAFEQVGGRGKPGFSEDSSYLRKDGTQPFKVKLTTNQGDLMNSQPLSNTYFYLRSPYRHDPDFQTNQIGKKDDITQDSVRPKRMIDVDKRVQDNYERLVGDTVSSLYSGQKDHLSVSGLREELIGRVRESMQHVFDDLVLEGIGDPFREGQFFFTKGTAKHFPYKNLSAGEKGAFDILLDLVIKTIEFNDTVIAIDEPELHMHSRLQKALLKELYSLIPNKCQLWVATHSIGFIREAIELYRRGPSNVGLVDFSNADFDQEQYLEPFEPTAKKIQDIFSVAIDDLSTMVTPSKVIICEGSLNAPDGSAKREFDTSIYNQIFRAEDVLFISGENKKKAREASSLLLRIIKQSGSTREVFSLVDRDDLTSEQTKAFEVRDGSQKFLVRKEIENYIFDPEIIEKYCDVRGVDYGQITSKLDDVTNGDAKAIQGAIMAQCKYSGDVDSFKKALAELITYDTQVYQTLRKDIGIFNGEVAS